MTKVRVLIADDSALMRQLLSEILNADPEIEVVGVAADAYMARELIKSLDPDVLTLDIEMPRMDGISFLEKLMKLRPMPVVMISAMTQKGADVTMKALLLGAVDFIGKPRLDIARNLELYADTIREKVKAAARSTLARHTVDRTAATGSPVSAGAGESYDNIGVIAIGASTGGVEAIHLLLQKLPPVMPPIVITQHIPPVFSASFARRLDEQLKMKVSEAVDGQPMQPGEVYIAPGDKHLMIQVAKEGYRCKVRGGEPVNRHMPAVDVLFDSVAAVARDHAVGVLLTGMGNDGARGLQKMRHAGARTIAQDRESSVVWGMPREAIELGAADTVLSLDKIPGKLISLATLRQGETT